MCVFLVWVDAGPDREHRGGDAQGRGDAGGAAAVLHGVRRAGYVSPPNDYTHVKSDWIILVGSSGDLGRCCSAQL